MTVEQSKDRPKKRRGKKFLLILMGIVVVAIAYYRYRDRPMKLVQTTNLDAEVDYKKGEIIDYHYAFDALQTKNIEPVEENGWRLILQALGPRALNQKRLADSIPWEDFPTSAESKEWFKGQWTVLCEKFKLDPFERPTMFDWTDLWDHVDRHGLSGDGLEPDDENVRDRRNEGSDWASAQLSPACSQLTTAPWTAEQYPNAARWIDENSEFYDLLAKAARSPRLSCWHIVPDVDAMGFVGTLLPDVVETLRFAQALAARANYRVGSGDYDGAIDDVETATLFVRAILESETAPLTERLIGLEALRTIEAVPVFANPDVAPTPEQIARLIALRSSFYRDAQFERVLERSRKAEETFQLGAFEDVLTARRDRRSWGRLTYVFLNEDDISFSDIVLVLLPYLAPVDDARTFQDFKELARAEIVNDGDLAGRLFELAPGGEYLRLPAKKRLFFIHGMLTSNLGFLTAEQGKSILEQTDDANKESTLALAILAYQAERGTLPPAFTVDENGAPLHSWRVLILPYLGEEERKLYEQIRLDEPWDSETNRAFWTQTPEVFRNSAAKAVGEDRTVFSVLLGENGFFDASGRGKNLDELRKRPDRDLFRQILIAERPDPVCWMKPDAELQIDDFRKGDSWNPAKFFEDNKRKFADKLGINVVNIYGCVRQVFDAGSEEKLGRDLLGIPDPEEDDEQP